MAPSSSGIIGGLDGSQLTFDPPTVSPDKTLAGGEIFTVKTSEPFVVKSQDDNHPFLIVVWMSGSSQADGYGEPVFVRMVPPRQYPQHYVFSPLLRTRNESGAGWLSTDAGESRWQCAPGKGNHPSR